MLRGGTFGLGTNPTAVVYPNGLCIDYQYADRPKLDYIGGNLAAGDPANTNRRYRPLSRRVLNSNWNDSEDWNFDVVVNNSDNTLTREIATPSGALTFKYRRLYQRDTDKSYINSTYEALYDAERRDRGKLLQSTRYAPVDANISLFRSRTRNSASADKVVKTFSWQLGPEFFDWRKIDQGSDRFKNRGGFYQANRVRLSSVVTDIFGSSTTASFKRAFEAYDKYNHPTQVREYSSGNTSNRFITQSYYNRTSPYHVVGKLNTRRIVGIGSTVHEYNNKGQRTATTENKIRTGFDYDTKGQLSRVTYADGTYNGYANYYRGIARTERNGNGHYRYTTVNHDGTVKTKSRWADSTSWVYEYDVLRRVSKVISPQSGRSIITLTWLTHDNGSTLTERQGGYTKVTNFNTLSLPLSENITGFNGTDNLYSSWERDVLGRVKNQQINRLNWDNGVASRFTYDGLDRLLR